MCKEGYLPVNKALPVALYTCLICPSPSPWSLIPLSSVCLLTCRIKTPQGHKSGLEEGCETVQLTPIVPSRAGHRFVCLNLKWKRPQTHLLFARLGAPLLARRADTTQIAYLNGSFYCECDHNMFQELQKTKTRKTKPHQHPHPSPRSQREGLQRWI